MAAKPPPDRPEPISSRINSVSSQFSDGGQAVSPSARSSISSWSEEPAHSNMDISTGHMILVSSVHRAENSEYECEFAVQEIVLKRTVRQVCTNLRGD